MAPKMFELPPPGGARTRDVGRLIDVIVFAVPPIPDIFFSFSENKKSFNSLTRILFFSFDQNSTLSLAVFSQQKSQLRKRLFLALSFGRLRLIRPFTFDYKAEKEG